MSLNVVPVVKTDPKQQRIDALADAFNVVYDNNLIHGDTAFSIGSDIKVMPTKHGCLLNDIELEPNQLEPLIEVLQAALEAKRRRS